MTPIEAAAAAVRNELAKMAHDPKEIARLAVKTYLEAATTQLASTGEHAMEDFFTITSDDRKMESLDTRVPALFSGASEPQANNVVIPMALDCPVSKEQPYIAFNLCGTAAYANAQKSEQEAREAKHNFSTNALLKLIQEEQAQPTITVKVEPATVPAPAEPVRLEVPWVSDKPLPSVSESEVIIWLYKTLSDYGHIDDNDVLDLSRTADEQGLDSIDVLELVLSAEEEYLIEVPDVELDRVATLHDFVNMIVNLRK